MTANPLCVSQAGNSREVRKLFRSSQCLTLLMALLLLLVGGRSFACERFAFSPLELNPDEVVFIGTVADITDPEQESDQEASARIKIKLRRAVSPPKEDVRGEYTILLYGLGGDCSKVAVSKSRALNLYPPGTEVWVIGTVDPQNSGVLEVWRDSGSYIQKNSADEHVNVRSRHSYCRERTFGPNPQRLAFELRKDLVRLREATSEEGRASILRRLAFHPEFRGWNPRDNFEKLVNLHLDDQIVIQDVMRFHKDKVKDRIVPICSR